MILQMHWQHMDGHYEFKAQADVDPDTEAMIDWARDVQKQHPPPDGTIWLMCDENAPMFKQQEPSP